MGRAAWPAIIGLAACLPGVAILLLTSCDREGPEGGRDARRDRSDFTGGTELIYRLIPGEGKTVTARELEDTIEVLTKRIDPANVKEYSIRAAGDDRIRIAVSGATAAEIDRLKRRLQQMGELEFRLVLPRDKDEAGLYQQAESGQLPEDVPYYVDYVPPQRPGDKQRMVLVQRAEPRVTGRYLSSVNPTTDHQGLPAVGFEFDYAGGRRFAELTEKNIGWSLAIILDGDLKSAPTIQSRIFRRGIITGRFTQAEVNDMVNILRAGSLPMDIELLEENTVGPQSGRDSIRSGDE